MAYCASRYHTLRRRTVEVKVGSVGVGGANPIRVQSMTTSDTQDIAATVRQSIALAEVGCEIVRITAPNVPAAQCLKEIRRQFSAAGFAHIPLVADIHFLPSAAMEAVEHVEKIRVNPGNYADKKKFAVREYTDADYDREMQRLYESFTPLVKRAKELGRALRIGTNHGSLSDRIMNRFGDSPLGMVESALEFVRIAESHGFHDLILSMKSSNPKVMIQAYRLLVQRMDAAHRGYPLHLGVTEAGDGEDGRIKGAIGIGTLLFDGVGDTIRVSLTEDSVYEIPVAQALARKAQALWRNDAPRAATDSIDPYHYRRRETPLTRFGDAFAAGGAQPPRVAVPLPANAHEPAALTALLASAARTMKDNPVELLTTSANSAAELAQRATLAAVATPHHVRLAIDCSAAVRAEDCAAQSLPAGTVLLREFAAGNAAEFAAWRELARARGWLLAVAVASPDFHHLAPALAAGGDAALLFTLPRSAAAAPRDAGHALGAYRALLECLHAAGSHAPLWIRNTGHDANVFLDRLLEASVLTGGLLCDGAGDLVSIENEADFSRSVRLAYNVLQGAGARISKTEFVACPSCGRTLFDLQTTTQRIRAATGHLKGVKIAVMGCIVNGPGEMADADFGYVGGAPGKINLYVGKTAVKYNLPEAESVARLVELIREHGKWVDPEPAPANA